MIKINKYSLINEATTKEKMKIYFVVVAQIIGQKCKQIQPHTFDKLSTSS